MISSVITLQFEAVRLAQHGAEIVERAELRMDVLIVGDVVAVVLERRRIEGHQPDGVDAQVADVFELRGQPLEIADAVVVGVEERLDVELVDDRILVPERVIAHRDPMARRRTRRRERWISFIGPSFTR